MILAIIGLAERMNEGVQLKPNIFYPPSRFFAKWSVGEYVISSIIIEKPLSLSVWVASGAVEDESDLLVHQAEIIEGGDNWMTPDLP